jgi:hypothetical protein
MRGRFYINIETFHFGNIHEGIYYENIKNKKAPDFLMGTLQVKGIIRAW